MEAPSIGERFFDTDAVRADLGRRSVRSSAVTLASRAAQMVLFLGSAMVLARVLTPADFGVQAMVLPLTILVNNIVNLGLQSAVIHRERLDHREASAVFWLALRINLGLTTLMAVGSPLLARWYGEPRVTWVGVAWAATMFGASLSAIHEALLKRQLRFGLVMRVQVTAMAVSVAAAILAAALGAGHWALMLQIAVMDLGRAAAIWIVCPWRPAVGVSSADAGDVVTYWRGLSGSRAITWAGDQVDRIFVGAGGGAAILGLYDSAKRWAWFPFLEPFLALSDVAVASLSRAHADPARFRAYVQNGFTAFLSVSLPALAYIFVESRNILQVVLGNQWLGAERFVQLMCVAAFVGCLSRLMQWVFMSTGQTARQFRWSLLTTPLMLVSLVVGSRWGAIGIAAGFTTATCLLAAPSVLFALRDTSVNASVLARVYARPAVASLAAAGVVRMLGGLTSNNAPLVALAVSAPLFAVVYALAWVGQPGGRDALARAVRGSRQLRERGRASGQPDEALVPRPGDPLAPRSVNP
jgi:PST family polysaccharide transporter